jgi:hypothetical protein
MLLASIFSYASTFLAASQVNRHKIVLYTDFKFVLESQWLVQNALGAFATMQTIVLFHQVTAIVDSLYKIGDFGPAFVFMGVLLGYLVIWLLIDILASRQIMPYLLTPFLLAVLAFVQILIIHIHDENHFFMASAIFLGFSCFLTITKMWNSCGLACCAKSAF